MSAAVFLAVTPHVQAQSSLSIDVDARIELIGVVQLLTPGNPVTTKLDFAYRRAAAEYFAPYASHPAVATFCAMMKKGFSYDKPIATMLHLGPPPGLEPKTPLPGDLLRRAGGQERLDEFLIQLRDFARASNYMAFWAKHQEFYRAIAVSARARQEGLDLVGEVERYYGVRAHGYFIILSPLTLGGFGPTVEVAPGQHDLYSVASSASVDGDHVAFFSAGGLRYLVWHEFGHSFANPIIDRHWSELNSLDSLFGPIKDRLPEWYRSWQSAVREHIVRAVSVQLARRYLGEQQGADELRRQVEWGFPYVPALADVLATYDRERERYPTFADFFPQIVAALRQLSEKTTRR